MTPADEKRVLDAAVQLQGFLHDGIKLFICKAETRELLANIRSECALGGGTEAEQTPAGEPGSPEAAASEASKKVCTSNELSPAFAKLKQQVGKTPVGQALLNLVRHVVVYMSPATDVLDDRRQQQLRDLAKEYRLPATRVAVIASPRRYGKADAERRARAVIAQLIHEGLPSTLIEQPWIYDLKLKGLSLDSLSPTDRPVDGEDHDLDRAVVILRLDC